jgi:hypothetical protein
MPDPELPLTALPASVRHKIMGETARAWYRL